MFRCETGGFFAAGPRPYVYTERIIVITRRRKNPTPHRQLKAIADLEQAGWSRAEIAELLNISERTYFARKAEIRELAGHGGDVGVEIRPGCRCGAR